MSKKEKLEKANFPSFSEKKKFNFFFYPVVPFQMFGTQALSLMMVILPGVGRSFKFQLENVFFFFC